MPSDAMRRTRELFSDGLAEVLANETETPGKWISRRGNAQPSRLSCRMLPYLQESGIKSFRGSLVARVVQGGVAVRDQLLCKEEGDKWLSLLHETGVLSEGSSDSCKICFRKGGNLSGIVRDELLGV